MSETTHLVLARKYRPQFFRDVIHQDIPINALQNALKHNRIGHAYIFFGPRGVGKTTIARVLAKRLNCENPVQNEPCNQCGSCIEITKGISNDVIEIDAASNRGVDDIRDLRENVKFNAMGGKYKVYIIDEVHMLSLPAFNALLKTLEEPPHHIVFILATTDYHKVPETILSRCQDFVFKKVPTLDLQAYIEKLCQVENLKYDEEGLFWIAKKGDGSVRDTLSFMEQAVTFTNGNLTGNAIIKMIGYQGIDSQIDFLQSILEEKTAEKSIQIIEKLYVEGEDLQRFLWGFLEFTHSSLLIRENIINRESINYPKEDILKIQKIISRYSSDSLVYLTERTYQIYEKISLLRLRNSFETKIYIEIQIQKLISELTKPSLSGILEKISGLTELIQSDVSKVPARSEQKPTASESPTQTTTPKTEVPVVSQQAPDIESGLKDRFSGVEVDSKNLPDIQ
jgi:DNA polymerase-3 subunit gamma/tau